MITRQVRYQLIAFLVISVIGLSYTAVRYAGLGRFFIDQGYIVSATFADSGGIFEGAEVTYRGVLSGKVVDLELVPEGVKANLRLDPEVEVPSNVKALVANRSAVGEQFIDLQPQQDGKPFLEEGSEIPIANTDIPISPTELVVNLDDFVTSVDLDALGTTLEELGKAFDGAGPALQSIIDDGNTLTQAALDNLEPTKTLIKDGNTALNTQRDVAGQFKSFNADLALLTDTLRSSDPDFRRLYINGTQSANQLTDLIRNNRTDLPILLSNLITFAQIQKVRLPEIEQTLVTYPNVVAGGFTVVPDDGTTHFGLVMTQEPTICEQGYEGTNERRPEDVSRRTPNFEAGCTLPRGSESSVRGAARAREAANASGGGSRVPATGEQAGKPAASKSTVFGDFNPRTNTVVTESGDRMKLRNNAGAARAFGADSWQWLLLSPLTK